MTDNEREAQVKSYSGWDADEVARYPHAAAEVIERLRKRLLDEFRRSAVPEPSAHDDGCADFYPEYGSPEAGVCKVCGDRAQGEPSDAQALLTIRDDIVRNGGRADAAVLAGLEALALRAAGGAR